MYSTSLLVGSDISNLLHELGIDLPVDYLEKALVHPSKHREIGKPYNYEQYETLGDAVLDLVVTHYLINSNPQIEPGKLTQQRSKLVNNRSLSQLGTKIDIARFLQVGNGYEIVESDIANAVEALFGALYLYSGLEICMSFFNKLYPQLMNIADYSSTNSPSYYNPIGTLQEFTQKHMLPFPAYDFLSKEGPDHDPVFTVQLKIQLPDSVLTEVCQSSSKQDAKTKVARQMLIKLDTMDIL